MEVRRRDDDLPGPDLLVVRGVASREAPRATEDGREPARRIRGKMNDDEHRGREVCGDLRDEPNERVDGAGRAPDDDKISMVHADPCLTWDASCRLARKVTG
jgi:hypothetical protein